MEKQNFDAKDAFCVHCGNSFLSENLLRLAFKKDGENFSVFFSPKAGDHTKSIIPSCNIQEGENVDFFCTECTTSLQISKNLFEIEVLTQSDQKLKVVISSVYGEEFTAVIGSEVLKVFGKSNRKDLLFEEVKQMIKKSRVGYDSSKSFIQ